MDVDQAIRFLEKHYPDAKVKKFYEDTTSEDPKGRYLMDLEINGIVYKCDGHLRDFQKIDMAYVEKVMKKIQEKTK